MMMHQLRRTTLFVAAFLAIVGTASAQLPLRHSFASTVHGSGFGGGVSGVGDINGDGYDDVIVGARWDDADGSLAAAPFDPFDPNGPPQPKGSARVYSGIDGALLHTFVGDDFGDFFGHAVSGAGDVNGDGTPDFMVSAIEDTQVALQAGSARVFSGANGSILYTLYGQSNFAKFGQSVAGIGDANNDGFDDVIVGTPGSSSGPSFGSATVFSGNNGSVMFHLVGNASGDLFGARVGGTGDVNGDGHDDFIVGAPGDYTNGPSAGRAQVFSGMDGSVLYTLLGDSAGDTFGSKVSGAGDVDADGFGDFVIGAPNDDNTGTNTGSVRVYSGFNGSVLHVFNGQSDENALGTDVSGAGDVNGDGFDDIIASISSRTSSTTVGGVIVFSGFDGTRLAAYDSDDYGSFLGLDLSDAGDVNGDGLDDVILGAPTASENGVLVGGARVMSIAGERRYGVGADPLQTLSCGWLSRVTAGNLSSGDLVITGATGFASGTLGLSIGAAQAPFLGTTLLIDATPGNFSTFAISFDATGAYQFPVNLRNPVLNGRNFFFQAAEANVIAPQGAFSSNGLELRFTH